jgi:hypothetical protein
MVRNRKKLSDSYLSDRKYLWQIKERFNNEVPLKKVKSILIGNVSFLMLKKADLELLESLFIVPEVMNTGYSFADLPVKVSFNGSNVVVYGIPLDITASFGKGTARGPEAIRLASARQIETFIFDEKVDLYDKVKIYDLGDLKIPAWIKVQEQ